MNAYPTPDRPRETGILAWQEIITPLLADPDTPIQAGKYLAIAEGGGITIDGWAFELHGPAMDNAALLERIVFMYRIENQVLHIHYRSTGFPGLRRSDYPFIMAVLADFHGVRHNFPRDRWPEIYQPTAQRLYAALRPYYPGYTPPEKLWRYPGMWLGQAVRGHIVWFASLFLMGLIFGGVNGLISAMLLWLSCWPVMLAVWWVECNLVNPPYGRRKWGQFAGFCIGLAALLFLPLRAFNIIPQTVRLPWEYDYVHRYGNNPAYTGLGRNERDFAQLVRDFRKQHPEEFTRIARDSRRWDEYCPEESHLWNLNTHEAQLLLKACQNVAGGRYQEFTQGKKNTALTYRQTGNIIRREAAAR